jgi:hypothetical protein
LGLRRSFRSALSGPLERQSTRLQLEFDDRRLRSNCLANSLKCLGALELTYLLTSHKALPPHGKR